jgi:filamentous hemagglutinin
MKIHKIFIFGGQSRSFCSVILILLMSLGNTGLASARDILRSGNSGTQGQTPVTPPIGNTPPPIAPANSKNDILALTASAIQASQALQAQAAALAARDPNRVLTTPIQSPNILQNIPDGLVEGGLKVDPGVPINPDLWKGANQSIQTTANGGKITVDIKQTAQQALLNWETFNVGKNTTVNFDQSAGGKNVGQWIAFNKVNDPTSNPTQILGSIKSQGQVYILNRNGVIFGGSSQINTGALVASALPINTNLVKNGLLNNDDKQFLFSAIKLAGGSFDPGVRADERMGDVIVEAGAKITAPSRGNNIGGRVALIGANVKNSGSILTPDGQTILAAGLQVGFDAHKFEDTSLRGLDTFIGVVVDPTSTLSAYAGSAINNGVIDAPRANVTIAGKDVKQLGVISSSTSVALNGRIDLLANYDAIGNTKRGFSAESQVSFLNYKTGTVELGTNSITTILPELASKDKIADTKLTFPSQVNITGKNIHFDNNATLFAPNALVTMNAGEWLPVLGATSGNTSTFIKTSGRIDLDAGALIDVSGSKNVVSSVTSNIVEVQLRGSELADSPLLRDGALRGKSIFVDVTKTGTYNEKKWVGTPLADVSGFANLVKRSVGELTASGGSVVMNAGDGIVIRQGANIDVSGGSINFEAGFTKTTKLVTKGSIVDILTATPDIVYDGIYTATATEKSDKWGVINQFNNPLPAGGMEFQAGFTQGGNGGKLELNSPVMAIDGKLTGSTIVGLRQRDNLPANSSLQISFIKDRFVGTIKYSSFSPTPPKVNFSNSSSLSFLPDFTVDASGVPAAIAQDRVERFVLPSTVLTKGGFGNLKIDNPEGDIVLASGEVLKTASRGLISFSAANIAIDGSIITPGGKISLKATNISADNDTERPLLGLTVFAPRDSSRGNFSLGTNGVLNTAGLIVDDRPSSSAELITPNVIGGGSISIDAAQADLAAGSLVDVSGVVKVDQRGRYTYGNAGNVSLTAKFAEAVNNLKMAGRLRGYSGAKGGTLQVSSNLIRLSNTTSPANAFNTPLYLNSDFFSQGGFTSFDINAASGFDSSGAVVAGLIVEEGATIKPQVKSLLASQNGDKIIFTPFLKPEALRSAVSINLNSSEATKIEEGSKTPGKLLIEKNSLIDVGVLGNISLSSQTIDIQGVLKSIGGKISINSDASTNFQGKTNLLIGKTATISAVGGLQLIPDDFNRRRGKVLDGGAISVSGNILAEAGAKLDVSGASGALDLLKGEVIESLNSLALGNITTGPNNLKTRAVNVASSGGKISLTGTEFLFSDVMLLGRSGGVTAAGGTLNISSGKLVAENPSLIRDINIAVSQGRSVIPAAYAPAIGADAPNDSSGFSGRGRLNVDDFTRGGFANLDLNGGVKFDGNVSITAPGRITVGTKPIIEASGNVELSAAYVKIGNEFLPPIPPSSTTNPFLPDLLNSKIAPVHGTGSFSVTAGLIDVGNLSLQNIGTANLTARNGDIRGNGTLAIEGNLNLTAAQIYPTTVTTFNIVAANYNNGVAQEGSITINKSGTRNLPLSAGGTLGVYASNIKQNGVLRAPFGKILLGSTATGEIPDDLLTGLKIPKTKKVIATTNSITSVSGIDPLTGKGIVVPYGISLNGTTWIDPKGTDITKGGLPQKVVSLNADNVITEKGSTIDLRGGGDLLAYRWIPGLGGSSDILASDNSFAVIPNYDANVAPFAPFSGDGSAKTNLGENPGYVNSSLQVGQRIRLDGGGGLNAGTYTLLPARYALLPGAFLITPNNGILPSAVTKVDKAAIVAGYVYNGLEGNRELPILSDSFEVASSDVIAKRAEYTKLSANTFFKTDGGFRLPGDAGQLIFNSNAITKINGNAFLAPVDNKFRGGLLDISSPLDILIAKKDDDTDPTKLVLKSWTLSSYGAESILIGGIRSAYELGTSLTITTSNIVVDNAGSPLTGSEIILSSKRSLLLKQGSEIKQVGKLAQGNGSIFLGSEGVAGSGNGSIVRVSGNSNAKLIRRSVSTGNSASLTVEGNVTLAGDSVTVDSSARNVIDSSANITTKNINLGSERISLLLDPSISPAVNAGLVLSSATLSTLAQSDAVSLTSYSSLDFLGSGNVGSASAKIKSLTLSAGELRGLGAANRNVNVNADKIILGNSSNGTQSGFIAGGGSRLTVNADSVELAQGGIAIRGFDNTVINASKSLQTTSTGNLNNDGNLSIVTPLISNVNLAKYAIATTGLFDITAGSNSSTATSKGLGGSLSLIGAGLNFGSRIDLPSGEVLMQSTSGSLNISGVINAGGTARKFKDVTRYTDGGKVSLIADAGNIELATGSDINVAAQNGGGNAGTLKLSAINGSANLLGTLHGAAGVTGNNGSFNLDVANLPSLSDISTKLNIAAFNQSRSFRVRNGDVTIDGISRAHNFTLSADTGSVNLMGTIDASGKNGGAVRIAANENFTMSSGSLIDVSAQKFNNAGKGGAVDLETRGVNGGQITLNQGSVIDLAVDEKTAASESLGKFAGTLHLRAPQNAASDDLQISSIASDIRGESYVYLEGYKTFDVSSNGNLTGSFISTIKNNGDAFIANEDAIRTRLSTGRPLFDEAFVIAPGAEVISTTGNITLGTAISSAVNGDWNFADLRYGLKQAPGVLTLRASGNIVLNNTISDGFASSSYNSALSVRKGFLGDNLRSWSYRFISGADFTATDTRAVKSLSSVAANSGSLKLGRNGGTSAVTGGINALTNTFITPNSTNPGFQVIRTGSGSIDIVAARDVQLLNQFATIYSAGTQVADATIGGTFDLPAPKFIPDSKGVLGEIQQQNPLVQYTLGGGNVSLNAGNDIAHYTLRAGQLVADSQRQMPNNWLYRRGYVNPATGEFGQARGPDGLLSEIASTTWWVDFSNFFEGVGALGGGNVVLNAGRDVINVDAHAPTNMRMPKGVPNADNAIELGGGDVTVTSGRNIDGGIYYVERGNGILNAENLITTNQTRSPSLTNLSTSNVILDSRSWLPTTLFAGKAKFDVKGGGDVLLGPVANPFLLPQGFNNSYFYKTYFSTYNQDTAVNVSSLAGNIDLRQDSVSTATNPASKNILQNWFESQLLFKSGSSPSSSSFQPWLRLAESGAGSFSTVFNLLPGTLKAQSFLGSINLTGDLTLSPAKTGTLELLSAKSINGITIGGKSNINSTGKDVYISGRINISDTDPTKINGITTPLALQSLGLPRLVDYYGALSPLLLTPLNNLFKESGATNKSLQKKQALHATTPLHLNDREPIRLTANEGDISGVALFSPKSAQITAGQDIRDISFYIQHLYENDLSIVAAGRDIIAFDTTTVSQVNAKSGGNFLNSSPSLITPEGDIQISGRGTLEVLAGRDLDFGTGLSKNDGTAIGITSIGNDRNPYLSSIGADIITAAGIGGSSSLTSSNADFGSFITKFILPDSGAKYLREVGIAKNVFLTLNSEEQRIIALKVF